MSRKPFLLMAALLFIAPANVLHAQDDGDKPAPTVRTPDGGREANVRGDRPRAVERSAPQRPEPAPTGTSVIRPVASPAAATPEGASAAGADDGQRRRDGSRDRGDNPPVGRAVPREAAPPPTRPAGPASRG